MTRCEILEKLKEVFKMVVSTKVDSGKLQEDSNIIQDLGVNSIGILYMAIAIEKTFNVDMTQTSISSFKTVKDVIDYIEKEQAK